jgi:MoxR-like ATPase
MQPVREAPNDVIAAFERASEELSRARAALRGVVFGQDAAVTLGLSVLVAGGHALVAGAPGVSKTRLVEALGQALGLSIGRLELRADSELADLVEPPDQDRREGPDGRPRLARLEPGKALSAGPVFRQLLLVERLDGAQPRVRQALVDAMQNGFLSHDGAAHVLPRPFHLMATGADGLAGGLDEAAADRFLVQIDLGWPDRDGERRMLLETAPDAPLEVAPALGAPELIEAQRVAVELPVGEKVVETILEIVRRARPDDPSAPSLVKAAVARGPGPRAGQALMRLARARALVDGRPSPSQADVVSLALPALKPRLMLAPAGRHGPTAETVVEAIVRSL